MDFWSIFKAIFEPSLVAAILFTGVYINRNKSRKRLPRENRVSYLLNKYPFIMEVIYLLLTYWIYQISRAISVFLPSAQNGTLVSTATQNAEKLIRLESTLGLFHELDVQKFFIQHPILLGIINRVYSYIHIPGTCVFFVWFFKTQKFDVYSPVRRALCVGNMIAFTIFTFWPCAPPRFLPEYGFIDTVHSNGSASIWTTNKFCNQYAAMPSLHMGYSFFVGMNLFWWGGVKSKQPIWMRSIYIVLGLFYPMLLLLAIVATGNHFFLDAVCGILVILLALATNKVLLVFWPIQQKLFAKLHIVQPAKKSDDEIDLPLMNSPSETRREKESSSLEFINV